MTDLNKETVKLTWEQVKELIPERVSLYYVDYRDSLDESTDLLQKMCQEPTIYELW